jgi:hypothetical protein
MGSKPVPETFDFGVDKSTTFQFHTAETRSLFTNCDPATIHNVCATVH